MGFKFNPLTGNLDLVDGNSVTSVNPSDTSLTISPLVGTVYAAINTANDNAWTGIQYFNNLDATYTPQPTSNLTINFSSNGSGFYAGGNSYGYYLYSYYYDASSGGYAYDPYGYYQSATDPNDSSYYQIDLSWITDSQSNGYIIYDFYNSQWIDVGNVSSYSLDTTTTWNSGSPGLSPNSISVSNAAAWLQSGLDYPFASSTIFKIGLNSGTNFLRFKWDYTGGSGSGALIFEDNQNNLRFLRANLSADILYVSSQLYGGNIAGSWNGNTITQSYGGTGTSVVPSVGSIPYQGSGSAFAYNLNKLSFDATNTRLGVGVSAPQAKLHLDFGTGTAGGIQLTNGSTTGTSVLDGFYISLTTGGAAELVQRENQPISFYTNSTEKLRLLANGALLHGLTTQEIAFSKFNIKGTGSGVDSPGIAIIHGDDTSSTKNGGIVTRTRMTSRYLQTIQNLGFNDNSFGSPGVIQWTAFEYSNNTYSTLATPTEFTGWSYQYYNGTAYQNLLRIHTSGIYIGAASTTAVPSAKLHVISTTEQARFGYDTSNYLSVSVSSAGAVTLNATGTTPRVIIPDFLFVGTGTPSGNGQAQVSSSSTQCSLQFTTTGTGYTSNDGFYIMYVDGTGVGYFNFEASNHIFYISGSERVRFSNTGAVLQVTASDCAQYTGAGSSAGGIVNQISSAGTAQQWSTGVGGTDNSAVNGRSYFWRDVTNSTYRMFLNTSGDLGIGLGNTAASARIHAVKTTEQLRLAYDSSNYLSSTTSSSGVTSVEPFGSDASVKLVPNATKKFSLWNATPIIQPNTGVASASIVGGAGTNITDTDTFDGYTIAQVVKALRNIGILA